MSSGALGDAVAAKAAARLLSSLDTKKKNDALERMAVAIDDGVDCLCAANRRDVQCAQSLVSSGELKESALERLNLTPEKIKQMARGVRTVAALDDPAGRVLVRTELDDDLELKKVTCPFGLLLAIVEARPDAIVQLSALALKSGNALMIKAGTEVAHTAEAIIRLLQNAIDTDPQVSRECLTNVSSRAAAQALLGLPQYIDLVVPRGSAELIRFVSDNTQIPVLGHADGVCHIYVHSAADFNIALPVILDAKTQAPATCNAVETVLVDKIVAAGFLPVLAGALQDQGVKLRGCDITREICTAPVEAVGQSDWHTEYGAMTLAIRVVEGCDVAIAHINEFGSHHTDCIVTEDAATAARFLQEVDSAGVFHNVSTRFSDGYRYGFGAEVGISTGKLHARGPVGLEGLVTYKYVLTGKGQCVSQYVGPNPRRFRHEPNVK